MQQQLLEEYGIGEGGECEGRASGGGDENVIDGGGTVAAGKGKEKAKIKSRYVEDEYAIFVSLML